LNKIVLAIGVFLLHALSNQGHGACLPSIEGICDDTPTVDASEFVVAQNDKVHWRPELEISYLAGDQDNGRVFITARLARIRNSFSLAGIEATANFAEADLSSSDEFVHVQGTLSGLVGLHVSSSSAYDLRAVVALGIVFGGAQSVDGDDFGYTEGIVGFQLEPRVVFEIKDAVPHITPIVSFGYLQALRNDPDFAAFRLAIGLAF